MDTLRIFKIKITSVFIISPYLVVLILGLVDLKKHPQMAGEAIGYSIMIPILLGLIWYLNKITSDRKNTVLNVIYRMILILLIGFISLLGGIVFWVSAGMGGSPTWAIVFLLTTILSFFSLLKVFMDTFFETNIQ